MNPDKRKAISRKIENNEPVTISFKFASHELLMIINSIIARYLSKMDHIFLLNSLVTILREILVNALKANAKRVYFIKKKYDIHDPESYKRGMARFKEEVIGDFDIIEQDLKNSDFQVKLSFNPDDKRLVIHVTNNAVIHPTELERVQYRIEKAKQYNDFSEAYAEVDDDTEGAGLGIVLTILFLKNMGVNPDDFKIETDGKVTRTSLVIPRELRSTEITTDIKSRIVQEIEGLPTFPEHVTKLIEMCTNPDTSIEAISEQIMLDPAITADVIKLSNSAGFITGKRIESVPSAVMTIGLKNVKAILMASNARKIMNERYTHYEQIWEHCNKVAAYARFLAAFTQKNSVQENAFMAGLLHDLGKIILLSTDLELVKSISDIVRDRKLMTSAVMEEISIGISHSEIGGMVALKWQFPEYLIDAISCHHAPHSGNTAHHDLVFVVYLANLYVGIEDRKYSYYYADELVLDHLGIHSQEDFDALHQKLKDKYEHIKKNL